MKSFNEHIGCTICDSFDITTSRRGPWVSEPIGTKLIGATTKYTNSISNGFTCLLHSTTSSNSGSWTYQSGPNTTDGPTEDENGVWDKELFECGENECMIHIVIPKCELNNNIHHDLECECAAVGPREIRSLNTVAAGSTGICMFDGSSTYTWMPECIADADTTLSSDCFCSGVVCNSGEVCAGPEQEEGSYLSDLNRCIGSDSHIETADIEFDTNDDLGKFVSA